MERKVTELKETLESGLMAVIEKVEKARIFQIQKKAFEACIRCIDVGEELKPSVTRQCMADAMNPIQQVEGYVQNELKEFQARLQRCQRSCEDAVRDKVPTAEAADLTEEQQQKIQVEYEECLAGCLSQHIDVLPTLEKRLMENLNKLL